MSRAKTAMEELRKKYGSPSVKDEDEQKRTPQTQATQPASVGETKSRAKTAMEELRKKYESNPKAWTPTQTPNTTSQNNTTITQPKTSYLETARNATQANISTGTGTLSDIDRESRRKELQAELDDLNSQASLNRKKMVGYQRGNVSNLLKEAERESAEIANRISEVNKQLEWLDKPETISYNDQLSDDLAAVEDRQRKAQSAVSKYSGEAGGRALAALSKEEREALYQELNEANADASALSREQDQIDYLNEYQDKVYDDTFTGQFGANYRQGRIAQDTNAAFAEYIANPTEANKNYAYALQELEEQFRTNNQSALDDEGAVLPWVTQIAAGYIPQLWDQTKTTVAGGVVGGLVGAAVGQPVKGAGVGITLARGEQSYNQMKGAAYRALIAEGMDEASALEAAQDEAFISALLEMGDTAFTLLTLGAGKAASILGNAAIKSGSKNAIVKGIAGIFGKGAANKAAKDAAKWAGMNLGQKAMRVGGGVLLNAGQEYAEEWAQEMVSSANQSRDGTGKWDLVGETVGLSKDALTGKNDEALSRAHEAGTEGFKIGLMFGGMMGTFNAAVSSWANAKTTAQQEQVVDEVMQDRELVESLIDGSMEMGAGTVSEKLAIEMRDKLAANEGVTRQDVARLLAANEAYVRAGGMDNVDQSIEQAAREAVGLETSDSSAPQDVLDVLERDDTQPRPEEVALKTALDAKQRVPYNAMSMGNPARQAHLSLEKMAGYGENGAKTFASIVESSNADPGKVRMEFQSAYEAGLTNLPRERASLLSGVQEEAYNAGRMDYIMQMGKYKDKRFRISKEAGFERTNLPADVTEHQWSAVNMLAKAAGVKVRIATGLKGNAEIAEDGTVLIDRDFQREVKGKKRSIVFYAAHEIGMHRLMQLAPEEGRAFINAVVQDKNAGLAYGQNTVTERRQAAYAQQGVELSTVKAMEEVAADSILDLYENEADFIAAVDRIINGTDEKAKKGARTFKDILNDLVRKLKSAVARLTGKEQAEAKQTLAEVEELRNLYETALKAATDKVKTGKSANNTGRTETDRGTISHHLKEGKQNDGAGSQENRKAFIERNERRGWKTQTFDGTALAYLPVSRAEAGGIADGIRGELSSLGIGSFFHNGLQANIDGTTKDMNGDAHTVPGQIVGINARTTKNVKEVAGHEAFHYWMASRGEFEKILVDNIQDYAPETIAFMMETVMTYEENGHIDNALLHEEFRARIAGMLHADKRTAGIRKMLRDYDTVKGAWDNLVAQNTGKQHSLKAGEQYSLFGDESASFEEDGVQHSLKSLRHDITEGEMFDDLVRAKVFTQKEADLLKTNLDKLISYMLPNANILDMNEEYGKDNRPYKAYKPNSDPLYGISLDFSTLCRKRLMTQYVIEQLQLRENRPMSAEEQMAIRSMLLEYRQQEKALQVACAMCYVEAARLKAPKQMERFFSDTDSIMRKHFAKKDSEFNAKVVEAQKKFKRDHGYDENAPKKDMKAKDVAALNKMSAAMRTGYKPNASQQAIINTAVKLPRSSFLTAANLTALAIDHPEIYNAYTDHIRASTRSKSLESDIPYYYGDSRESVSDTFIDNVNAENGMRFDSWSDFQMKHMLDMITAVIDLSVRKSKMHGYTKFPEMVRIFGKTGMMFNLSGVADGNGFDSDGNLLFSDTESIDFDEAIKLRKAFPETAGLQCIGVSDDHIRALLRSDDIDYVIPYHTSGMNAALRRMAGIYEWKDYTHTQHARKDPNAKKPANAENWQVEPVWSEFFVNEGEDGYEVMQNTAKRYVEMCRKRGLIPKFDQFLDEDGYWKLLVDRKMVNQETGDIIEQKAVRPVFDFDLIQQEIDREVNQYDPGLEQRALKYVVDNFDAVNQRIKDLKKRHPKKAMLNMGNEMFQAYAEGSKRDSDTQYSLKEQDDLMRENARLKEVNENLREQFKTTEFAKVDKKALRNFAKQLLKDYSSGADIDETRDALDELYTYLANGEDGMTPSWSEAYKRAYETAVGILEASSALDDEMYRQYKDLRDRLRTTRISISPEHGSDLMGYENLQDFRRRNMGRLNITKDGIPVDVAYAELAGLYPELFDEYTYSAQGDQLVHIADVLESMQPMEINPYSLNMRENATWLANDIMERFFELPQAKPTFADKAQRKLTNQAIKDAKKLERVREQKNERIRSLIEGNREKVKQVQAKERDKRLKAVQDIKEHYKAKEGKASESRKARDLRARVVRHAEQMSKKLLRGTDKSNVPEALKGAVAELLAAINMESNYTYDPATGGYRKSDDGLPTRRTEEFRKVREQYEAIAKNNEYGMVLDPNLLGVPTEGIPSMLDQVIAMKDIRLADMNLSQLQVVYDVLRVMEHSIQMAGKMLTRTRWESIHAAAENFKEDTATRRTKRALTKDHKMLDIETPYTFFSHFGNAGKDFFRMLRNAQDAEEQMQDQLRDRLAESVSLEDRQAAEKETVTYTTQRGDDLTLSKAHIMNIYLLNKRKQAQQHLLSGGIVQPEIGKVRKGTDAVLLNELDVANIISKLSDKEREMADALQKLTLLMAEWGNKASMTVYGIKKFNDPDYWTIHSSDIGINQTVEQGQNKARSIANMGSAKAVIPEARNTLDIGSAFEVFDRHASDMMCYSAWLAPMEDANRLFNYKYRDADWNPTGKTMKGIIDRVGGEGSTKYWLRLMEDIQNGLSAPADTASEQGVMKAIGNVKKAAVSANLRVVIQQPTAYARAAVVLDPDIMLAALAKDTALLRPAADGWKKAVQYAPIAARKAAGGYEVAANPKQLAELLYQPKSKKGKAAKGWHEAPLWLAGKMDQYTWGTIWNACEMQVARDNKALKKDSDAFNDAVKELFTDVIDQTQVVDGVLQRSQAMRSGSNFMKQMTSFTGEPTQGANMVIRAYDQLRYEQDPKKRGRAIKKLSRAVGTYMFVSVLNAFAQSLIDGLRDDDEDKEYWERVWTAFHGINGNEETWWDFARNILLASNVVNNMNPATWLPVWKDALSVIQGYSVERMDAASLGDFFDSMTNVVKSVEGDGKYTTGYAALKAMTLGHKLLGGSSSNFLREVESFVRTIQVETDSYLARYETMKLMTKPENNLSEYVGLLFKAYQNDQQAYKTMYDDLVASGVDPEKIKDKMESLMKKAQGVKKVDDLDQRYLSPAQQKEYSSTLSGMKSSSVWKNASAAQQDDVEGMLYDLTVKNAAGEKLQEKIDGGARYGLDETEYLLYKLALDMCDEPSESGKLGSYTNDEVEAAIRMLGLSAKESAYLWDAQGKSEKSNPWRK